MWNYEMNLQEINSLECSAEGNVVSWKTLKNVGVDDFDSLPRKRFPCKGSKNHFRFWSSFSNSTTLFCLIACFAVFAVQSFPGWWASLAQAGISYKRKTKNFQLQENVVVEYCKSMIHKLLWVWAVIVSLSYLSSVIALIFKIFISNIIGLITHGSLAFIVPCD